MREARFNPLLQLTISRTREFLRQGEALFWVFVFPILLAFALGFAFREKPPEKIPIGVIRTAAGNPVFDALAKSPALLPRIFDEPAGREALRTGRISLLVQTEPKLVYHLDPTRPDARVARLEANDALQRAAGRRDLLQSSDQPVKENGSRYIDFLIPGLLGMNLMGTGMWGVGFSIVTARTQKLLKRLIATPMKKSHFLAAQMLSRLLFLVFEVVLLLAFGWLVFDVGIHGSIILLSLICLLGAMAFTGLGLLVASRVETIEGVSGLMNFVMLPMWLLSGVFFSYERFPDAAHPFIRLLPLTALNDALRGVMNEGATMQTLAPQMAILTGWVLVSFAVALKIFKWR